MLLPNPPLCRQIEIKRDICLCLNRIDWAYGRAFQSSCKMDRFKVKLSVTGWLLVLRTFSNYLRFFSGLHQSYWALTVIYPCKLASSCFEWMRTYSPAHLLDLFEKLLIFIAAVFCAIGRLWEHYLFCIRFWVGYVFEMGLYCLREAGWVFHCLKAILLRISHRTCLNSPVTANFDPFSFCWSGSIVEFSLEVVMPL